MPNPPLRSTTAQPDEPLKMYGEIASWWPVLSAPEEYENEARFYGDTLVAACAYPPRTMLELGSGGGNNASHLKSRFTMTLVDRAPGMLDVSRRLNPECEHFEGDLRSIRLGREFDCVFIHDAVSYLVSEEELAAMMETVFVHCRPGGAVLLAPDHIVENFRPATDCGGTDTADRSLRYLEWVWDPDPSDTTFIVDYAYLLRTVDGSVTVKHDRHVGGLFPRAVWLRHLAAVGFESAAIPFDDAGLEGRGGEVLVGRKPKQGEDSR